MPGTPKSAARELRELSVDELAIDDEASFRHVALYADLKEILRRHGYRFRVLPDAYAGRWDRALVLNLTYWDANAGGDILADLDAGGAPGSAEALFVGEAIASAFDVYLVGRLLGHSPDSLFLQTQVPAMAESAQAAGLTEEGFEELLEAIAAGPDRAFEDLRELLYDASLALASCRDADQGLAALARFDGHRFAPLLHHYELSNWVLYARAYAHEPATPDLRVRELDASLRGAGEGALDWLTSAWVAPALSRPPAGQPAG